MAKITKLSLACSLLFTSASFAQAQEALAQFYKGKTVYVVIGSAAGGGFDTYGRLIARHIGKHIPGNPNVVPQNMPGAGAAPQPRMWRPLLHRMAPILALFILPSLWIQFWVIAAKANLM